MHRGNDVLGEGGVACIGQRVNLILGILGELLRDIGLRVVEVAIEAGASRAALHTRRELALGGEVMAKVALLHNAGLLVIAALTIRAGLHARLAADALLGVNEDNAGLLVAVGGAGGANLEARGILALLAHRRQRVAHHVGVLTDGTDNLHLVPGKTQGHLVLHLAGHLAGVAASAAVNVDDYAITRHSRTPPR